MALTPLFVVAKLVPNAKSHDAACAKKGARVLLLDVKKTNGLRPSGFGWGIQTSIYLKQMEFALSSCSSNISQPTAS